MSCITTLRFRSFLKVCLLLALAIGTGSAKANHILGGELSYVYLSGTGSSQTYKISLTVFADCGSASSTSAFALLPTATPQVNVYNNNALFATRYLTTDASLSNVEITPVCPKDTDSTNCTNLTYVIPGVVRFVYTDTVTLIGNSANWRFAFEGNMVNSSAGRSAAISNINTLGGTQLMYLEALLNNTNGNNTSTNFTSPPTPFFCINVAQSYALNAVDPNGDSLAFSLIGAKVTSTANAPYIAPYTPANPLPAAPGTFAFNPNNGLLNFTPNLSMEAVVVDLVDEYRNGIKVGSSMREMTFVILPTCNNAAPSPGTLNLVNGVLSGNDSIDVCEGMTDTLRFGFTGVDAEGDTLNITYTNLPAGAIVNITDNNTPNPVFSFKWDVSTVPLGSYTFFVTIQDKGCPISNKQTIGYTINVVPFQGVMNNGSAAGCKGEHNGYAWVHTPATDTATYQFTWHDATNTVVQTSAFSAGDTLHNALPGTYTIDVLGRKGCHTALQVTVDTPTYQTSFSVDTAGCLNQTISFYNTSTSDVTSYEWDFGDGATSNDASPGHTYTQPGKYTVRLIGHTGFPCQDTAYATINIHEVILTVSGPQIICQGSSVPIFVQGALNYIWTPADGLSCTDCDNPFAGPEESTIYTVTGSDAIGCNNVATVQVNVIPTGLLQLSADTSICPGDSVHLHASGAMAYHWTPDLWITDTAGSDPVAYPTTTMEYTVYGTQQQGCIDTGHVTVTVYPHAVLTLPDSVGIYPGESYQIDPGGNCVYFQWQPPLGLSSTNIANPLASPPVNTRYFVTAATEAGCRISDSMDVYVNLESLIDMPNAFTPGSGPNSVIKPVVRGLVTLQQFKIYNRWGETVFETTDISKGWDGSFNGQPQPMGVYVYIIEAQTNTGKRFSRQGNITLIR